MITKWTKIIALLVFCLIPSILLTDIETVFAYDNKVTHKDLTEIAVRNSLLRETKNQLSNLGKKFSSGELSDVNGLTILEWIRQGADFEDGEPGENSCRASNHFHNPIKGWQSGTILGWDNAQMTDGALTFAGRKIDDHCEQFGWSSDTRKSNISWATEFLEPVSEGVKTTIIPKQLWSWGYARNHFYTALTSAESETREIAFSNAFRAIGQVIHLIQDAAQPAHVRNDFQSHLVMTHIGIGSPISWVGSPYEHYVKTHPNLVTQALPIRPEIENPSLTDFWDTNSYDGTIQLSDLGLGLAEYANANYFSEETIPNNVTSLWQLDRKGQIREHLFPYPALNTNDYVPCSTPSYAGEREVYIARKSRGGCESGDRMAQLSLLSSSTTADVSGIPYFDLSKARMAMDNKVYKTYAKELLPLAIGYSSALIDYFFRGRLGVIKKPDGLVIKNNSAEPMSAYQDEDDNLVGKIEIFYDQPDSSRHLLAEHMLNQPLQPGERTPLISFATPVDNITPDRYIAVFKGKLGKEEAAVMARVVSPKIYYVAQHEIDSQIVRKIMRMEADGQFKTVIFDNKDPNFIIDRIAISPDGNSLAFSGSITNGSAFIYTLDISDGDTQTPTQISEGLWPDWSPDGDKLVFQKGGDSLNGSSRGQVFNYDLNTGAETLLAGGIHRSDAQPAWSPMQDTIAYVTDAADEVPDFTPGPGEIECGNYDQSIELMDATGVHTGNGTDCLNKFYSIPENSSVTSFGARVSNIQQPVWHPDGTEIMYLGTFKFENPEYTPLGEEFRHLKIKHQPFKINLNTQEETALFDINAEDNFLHSDASSWSLDGEHIAITRLGWDENGDLAKSRSKIILIDAISGNKLQDLTTLGRYNPDFGY